MKVLSMGNESIFVAHRKYLRFLGVCGLILKGLMQIFNAISAKKSFNSSFLFPIWLSSYLLQMGKFKPITSSASITSELEKVQLEQLKFRKWFKYGLKALKLIQTTRPERAEAPSPGQRPGYNGNQQVAL